MLPNALTTLYLISTLTLNSGVSEPVSTPQNTPDEVVSERTISLDNRLVGTEANAVYKDNILLNLAYMRGLVNSKSQIEWDQVRQPFTYEFILAPDQVFSYHDAVMSKYEGKVVKTTNSHFSGEEGYLTDGNLYGMGVCHMASVIYWAAKDANLESEAPTNHNFAVIREVPAEYGVAIYNSPLALETSSKQNLYITNSFDKDIAIKFEYDGSSLKVSVLK